MTDCANEDFIRFLWTRQLYTSLDTPGIRVLNPGTANPSDGIDILDAKLEIDGTVYCGPIAVHCRASDWHRHLHHIDCTYDSCILNVVLCRDRAVCRTDGSVIPTVAIEYPDELQRTYGLLIDGSESYGCGRLLAAMPDVKRYNLLTALTVERLERKFNDFLRLYRETGNNWNEAFYITLFRTMGAGSNREPYMKLARTVSYTNVCKVKESILAVEAMLLGGAGLLSVEYPDDYTHALQREFDHLSRRFGIVPMRRAEWSVSRHNPHNAPLIRIVELAALLASREFMFSRLIACKTTEEIHAILAVEASEYWKTHYLPGRRSRYSVKSFGSMMLDNLCINLVAPMMFTYGQVFSEEPLKETAIEILEKTEAENNMYIRGWKSTGIRVENAFFSQGLLQLSREYCEKKRCTACNIGRNVLCCQ